MTNLPENAALIVIDVQVGLDDPQYGPRNNPDAEANIARLLEKWRMEGRPIFYVQHMSTEPKSRLRPELPGNAIKPIVAPQGDEPVIQKTVNSGFIGTDLEARLRAAGIDTVIMTGLTTNHCVSTTARMAENLGFKTFVVADATAANASTSYDGTQFSAEQIHAAALASLHGEFATIVETAQLLD